MVIRNNPCHDTINPPGQVNTDFKDAVVDAPVEDWVTSECIDALSEEEQWDSSDRCW
jgi:hypothetical protein